MEYGRGVFLLITLAVLAAIVGGCGTQPTTSRDHLSGSWRTTDYKTAMNSPWLVIAKSPSGYHATLLTADGNLPFALKQSGNRLRGTVQSKRGPLAVALTYQPGSGHLSWRTKRSVALGAPRLAEYVRFGDATALASPQP